MPAYDAVERFRQAMFDAGLRPDEIADTSGLAMPERCPVADDRPGKKSGWYVFYGDGVSAGAFGNWKTGEEWKWSGKSQSTMTSRNASVRSKNGTGQTGQRSPESGERRTGPGTGRTGLGESR